MQIIKYLEKGFIKKASNAINNGESIQVVVEGWRAKVLERSFPLFLKYFFLDERDKKKLKFYQMIKFWILMPINGAFWGFAFSALNMKTKVDYYKEGEKLMVLFQKEDNQPFGEVKDRS